MDVARNKRLRFRRISERKSSETNSLSVHRGGIDRREDAVQQVVDHFLGAGVVVQGVGTEHGRIRSADLVAEIAQADLDDARANLRIGHGDERDGIVHQEGQLLLGHFLALTDDSRDQRNAGSLLVGAFQPRLVQRDPNGILVHVLGVARRIVVEHDAVGESRTLAAGAARLRADRRLARPNHRIHAHRFAVLLERLEPFRRLAEKTHGLSLVRHFMEREDDFLSGAHWILRMERVREEPSSLPMM